MISIERALELVLSNMPARRTEQVSLADARGRILAREITAAADVPSFNRSAMDGYAVRSADVAGAPVKLKCIGTVRAGGGDPGSIDSGQAKAIMTGAPVPEGADAVQMVELTHRSEDGLQVTILEPVKKGANIAPAGCEAKAGEIVLEPGRFIGPAEIAVLAGFGHGHVHVWKPPRVALFATGDELVEVPDTPRPDQIRNSNAPLLSAQLRLLGLEPEYLGIARDDRIDLRDRLGLGLQRDVVILTGGVSMGEFDLVQDVFRELGLEIIFSRVAMRPGKPTVFALAGEKLVFGLPGNPVSAFIAFENLVRPALGRLCGFPHPDLPRIRGELLRDLQQTTGRTSFLPSWAALEPDGWKVDPLRWKGSADIIGFSRANAAAILPAERGFIGKGEPVEALLLPDYFSRSR